MYTDYTLKFTDADEATAVLFDGEQPRYAAIDVIGVIYKPTGKMLAVKGEEPVQEMAPLEGWHVNVRHAGVAPELDAYAVEVKTPVRVWA